MPTKKTAGQPANIAGHPTRAVPIDEIITDDGYHRQWSEHRAHTIEVNFDMDRLTPPILNERAKNEYVTLDGATRLMVLKRLGYTHVYAIVLDLPDQVTEAALFMHLNTDSKKLSARDRHRANVTANEPVAVIVEELLRKYGCTALQSSTAHQVGSIATMRSAWGDLGALKDAQFTKAQLKAGTDVLRWVLEALSPLLVHGDAPHKVFSKHRLQGMIWLRRNALNSPALADVQAEMAKLSNAEVDKLLANDSKSSQGPVGSIRGSRLARYINSAANTTVVDLPPKDWDSLDHYETGTYQAKLKI